tara:strand:- start:1802 stop:2101 length:300 start_codon:yes stop_codon:yes gene_type:complete
MINREKLSNILNFTYKEPIDETNAWNCFTRFRDYIEQGDKETIKFFCDVAFCNEKEMLLLRNVIAELGFELTPNQLSQYIFLLTLCLLEKTPTENEKQS